MKNDIRGPIFAVALLIVLGLGVYLGVAVYPKKEKFWTTVTSVTDVTGAKIYMDGKTIIIEKVDGQRIFDLMRLSHDYSPNHPVTIRKGKIVFDTNIGEIAFSLLDTSNQGILLGASGNGWNYGEKRCDELRDLLPPLANRQAQQAMGGNRR